MAELWMELQPEVLHYLSIAMKMEAASSVAETSEPQKEPPAESQGDDDGGHADAGPVRSPHRKTKKRRFQPKKSPKKKARKVNKGAEPVEEGSNQDSQAA
eukprot:s3366_g4.t1